MKQLTIKQIKKIELDILVAFSQFCDKHQLRYFLAYGSLLGAIRHKGFIPWDDDIDVIMPRADYQKLGQLMSAQEIRSDLEWQSYENGKYHAPFGKVVNINTRSDIYGRGLEYGLWIDVFPIDNYDPHVSKQNSFWRKIFIAKDTKHFNLSPKSIGKLFVKCFFCWITKEQIIKRNVERALATPQTGLYANMLWEPYPQLYIDNIDDTCMVEFEGQLFKTVAYPEKFLTLCYHDYTQLPPIEKRVAHETKAYWIGENDCPY